MSPKSLYISIGAAWGLTLGVITGVAIAVIASGVGWLFIYGDNPWPDDAMQNIGRLAVIAGLAMFTACVITGWRYGARIAESDAGTIEAAIRRGHRLLLAWLVVTIVLTAAVGLRMTQQDAQRTTNTSNAAMHAQLALRRHDISSVGFSSWRDNEANIEITVRGERQGTYALTWTIREQAYKKILDQGERVVELGPDAPRQTIYLDLEQLKDAYGREVLNGAAGVLVDEAFRIDVELRPILSTAEQDALGAAELQNLALGESPLIVRRSIEFPVRFGL